MTQTQRPKRHFFRHFICAILSVLLTISLVVTGLVGVISMALFDRGMHESVALDKNVTASQMARIAHEFSLICDTYPLSPDTLHAVVTQESIIQYNRDVIAWWTDMLQNGNVTKAPVWNDANLVEVIRADEAFQAAVPSALQKSTARDKVAVAVQDAITSAVMPVRSVLITFAMSQLLAHIDLTSYTAILRVIPLVTLAVSALLTTAIALIFRGRPRRRAIWGSSPFMAVGIITLYSLILLALLNIPGQVAIMSESFALQLTGLMRVLYLRMALISAVCLVGGAAWMHLAYRASRLKQKQEVSQ